MANAYLLHGENLSLSRSRLNELAGWEVNQVRETIRLAGDKITLSEIKQAVEAKSLFGGERLVIVEGLLSSALSKRREEISKYLQEAKPSSFLILWESKPLKETVLAPFRKNFKIEIFKIPATVFMFLDSVAPGRGRQMLFWLHQISLKEPEMVFSLLVGRIRQLLQIKDSGGKELGRLAGWQKEKLGRQSQFFTVEQLKTLYRKLLEMDYQQKTSQAPLSLFFSLDLLVSSL